METILFFALSQAIMSSILQGLIIYAFANVILTLYPAMPSHLKYKILYSALMLTFGAFVFSLASVWLGGIERSASSYSTSFRFLQDRVAPVVPSIFPGYTVWISSIYFAGLFIQSILLLLGLFHIQKSCQDKGLLLDPAFKIKVEFLMKKLRVEKKVRVFISDKVLVPFTAGFIKPVIIFPIALVNSLTPEQVETILMHELAHIRRNDYLHNLLQRLVEVILFFNPVIWLLSKEIRKEREFCCDDLVLQNSPDPAVYARALLEIARNTIKPLPLALSVSGERKFTLLNRIKRLTDMKTSNSNSNLRGYMLFGIAAVCISLAWIVPVDTSTSKQPINKKQSFVTHLTDTQGVAPLPILYAPDPPLLPGTPQQIKDLTPLAPPLPPLPADTNELKKKFNSPEWKKHMEELEKHTAELKKKFNSPEWKKQMEDMKINAEAMKKKFDSPEWKKQMEDMKINAEAMKKKFDNPEWKKQMEDMKINSEAMRKKFDSPEWKKQIEDMKINSEAMKEKFNSPEWKKQMEDMKINAEGMRKKFDSPEWKKQIEDMKINAEAMKKKFDSPEWKKQIEDMKINAEAMKKKFDSPK